MFFGSLKPKARPVLLHRVSVFPDVIQDGGSSMADKIYQNSIFSKTKTYNTFYVRLRTKTISNYSLINCVVFE